MINDMKQFFKTFLGALLVVVTACSDVAPQDNEQGTKPPADQPTDEPSDRPTDNPTDKPTDDKSISILAIGNSFSVDAMEYLYGMLEDVGYEEIVLGNLYIGGCTLETHAGNFQNNSASYTYYTNTTGKWSNVKSYKPLDALSSQDWDIVTMQQGSPKSGQAETFDPYLGTLVDIVKQHEPQAKLAWHMTWAYQANSTHSGFANYSNSQMTMYNAIVAAAKSKILTNDSFSTVIPNGTAVQNMRTSYVGDNLTRDGYHMAYDLGRYLTALTFAKALTGCDLEKITYIPDGYTFNDKAIAAMKDAASNAVAKPFEVTQSAYPPDNTFDAATATIEQIFEHEGYDPAIGPSIDFNFGKWFTPSIGMRAGYQGLNFISAKDADSERLGYMYIHGDFLWNASNAISGYKETRFWNLIPYVHTGFFRSYGTDGSEFSDNEFAMGAGLLHNLRLTDRLDIMIDMRATVVNGSIHNSSGAVVLPSVTAGVAYDLGWPNFVRTSTIVGAIEAVNAEKTVILETAIAALEVANASLEAENMNLMKKNSDLKKSIKGMEAQETVYEISYEQMQPLTVYFMIGRATLEDLDKLEELCYYIKQNSLCGLGQTAPNPVLATLKFFREEYIAHIVDKTCPAGVCKKLVKYEIVADQCKGCTLCSRKCPVGAISGTVKNPHEIDANKCIKCGVCIDNCKFGAIIKK